MLQLFLGRDYNNRRFSETKEFFESCSNQLGWVLVKDPKSSFVEEGMLVLTTVYFELRGFLFCQVHCQNPKPLHPFLVSVWNLSVTEGLLSQVQENRTLGSDNLYSISSGV
jgi:hypothetical protein